MPINPIARGTGVMNLMEPPGEELPEVILGCQPFLGESYQGPERNREYTERFSTRENMVAILVKASMDHAVRVLAAVPARSSSLAGSYLQAIAEAERTAGTEFSLAPCFSIPLTIGGRPVDDYRRWLTYYACERAGASEDLSHRYLSDPILLTRPGWKERFPELLAGGKPYTREELKKLAVDFSELESRVADFHGKRVLFAELGSEADFLAMTGRFRELEELVGFLRDRGFAKVFFGVHHAGVTIPLLEGSGVRFEGYVTPVNQVGALMLPTREAALQAVRSTRRKVVAIKTMAGGRLPPSEALRYVFLRAGMRSCMIGVGSLEELDVDMRAAVDAIAPIGAAVADDSAQGAGRPSHGG